MICGHGSREAGAEREYLALVAEVALQLPQFRVEAGFLEFGVPTIHDGLEKLHRAGCTDIVVLPGTLFSGGHSLRDIPAILRDFAARFPDIRLRYGRAFDIDATLVKAACARMFDAIEVASGIIAPAQTALLVAGRGASDGAVLSTMQTLTRLIQNETQFSHYQTAYVGIAAPRFPDALEQIAAQPFRRVVVLPYFLFGGMLLKRIYAETDYIAARYPATQFVKASHLGNHPYVLESFVARIRETSTAGTLIND